MAQDKNSPVFRYLPTTLLAKWAKSPNQDPVWGEWLHGSLMHCDVTGFTAMNEALASMGHEGAEVMAKILNQFFERMLRIGENWNGIQMKFGGDAMLLYFPNDQHAICAAKCGLEMQEAMKEFSKIQVNDGVCQLRMRIGIHSGRFFSASLGSEEGLHYLLSGHDVNRAADVEPLAEPGQVVISDETANLIKDCSRLSTTKHEKIWEVKRVDPLDFKLLETDISNPPLEILSRYLMPSIADGSATNLIGEHRRATIAFIYLFGLSDLLEQEDKSEAVIQANKYLQLVLSIAHKYSGSLLTSDVAEHADKLVVVFGVPISSGKQEENCLRFAFELNEVLKQSGINLRHQIGVNTGFIFAGEIGSSWRREYTIIGDNMNLAARLMAAAGEGNILVSAMTAEKAGNDFKFKELEPIRVKGKSHPIKISRLVNVIDNHEILIPREESVLYGRDAEMSILADLASNATAKGPISAFVYGDPGIGKSSLCEKLLIRLQNENWKTTHSICQLYNIRSAYSAWKYPLLKLFGISQNNSNGEKWDLIHKGLLHYCPDLAVFSPLIADMLSIPYESNSVVDSLDAKTKHEKRITTVKSLVANIAREKPLCLLFDNLVWMDSSSAELIRAIQSEHDLPLLIVFASRSEEIVNKLFDKHPDEYINLQPLSDEASREFINSSGSYDQDFLNKLVAKTGGNPLFIKELIQSDSLSDGALPDSIYDMVMVKLDHLPAEERAILRNASVIGQVFDTNILASIRGK